MVNVAESNVKHKIPAVVLNDLAGGDLIFFPRHTWIRFENRIVASFGPGDPVGTGGVADRVGFVLFAARIPHPKYSLISIPENIRAHDGDLFPRSVRHEHRFGAHAFPDNAVWAGGVTNR